jgi:hypothetical protein
MILAARSGCTLVYVHFVDLLKLQRRSSGFRFLRFVSVASTERLRGRGRLLLGIDRLEHFHKLLSKLHGNL